MVAFALTATREPIVKRQKVTNLLIRNFLILNKPERIGEKNSFDIQTQASNLKIQLKWFVFN